MPIHLASYFGEVEMLRMLIGMGSNPNVPVEGEVCTVCMYVCTYVHVCMYSTRQKVSVSNSSYSVLL